LTRDRQKSFPAQSTLYRGTYPLVMTNLRFALLNAAHDGADTRRNFRRELDADLVEFHAPEGELPTHFAYDAVVVTGSRSSVYWDEPWIEQLIDYVSDAAARDIPVLGVCYGHQVLAEALGGAVDAMGEFEIGYNTVEKVAEDSLLNGITREFTVFTTHGDAVVELPPDATLLAENEYGIHAFRKGHCYGVQFHPEYDRDTAESVTKGKEERIGSDRVASVLETITAENYNKACEVKSLFENFTAYVRELQTTHADTEATA